VLIDGGAGSRSALDGALRSTCRTAGQVEPAGTGGSLGVSLVLVHPALGQVVFEQVHGMSFWMGVVSAPTEGGHRDVDAV